MFKRGARLSRRKFIALGSSAALSFPVYGAGVAGANERVRVALVGCGGRGRELMSRFLQVAQAQVVAVCDPDTRHMDGLLGSLQRKSDADVDLSHIDKIQDYRRLYERRDIDAVVIASPNHWHALHAIQAMKAGKDVYVEKPVSHSVWEGEQLVAAQKKYGRVAAAGFQNRSDPGPQQGIRFVQEGNLGKIISVRVCCFRNRGSIGARRSDPLPPPATCDYNLWLGPAQEEPIYRPNFHYDWHWVWNTGDGDIGNQAPHEIDLACWLLGDGPLPSAMQSFGGRFGWNDAGETPNMMTAWYEQAGIPVTIEVNDVKLSPERNASPHYHGIRVGLVVQCEGGELRGGRGGMYAVGEDGKTKIKKFGGNGGRSHQKNFIDAVRSGNADRIAAPIGTAERSSALAHLANVSLRTGAATGRAALDEAAGKHPGIQQLLDSQQEQLKAWGIENPSYTLGAQLRLNPETREVYGPGLDPQLIRLPGRGEFTVPELV